MCARAAVTNDNYEKHLCKIRVGSTNKINRFARAFLLHTELVQWRPKRLITLADALCHLATLTQTSQQTTADTMFEKLKYIDADYQIFTDGGSEEGGISAGLAIIR